MSFNSNATTPEMLVKSLIKRKWTEDEKVRAIYGWIVKNIEYDITMDIFNKQLNRTELEMIMESFNKRQGTCHNYSLLFQYMCERIGIEVKRISGKVKFPPSQAGMFSTDHHGWNMIKTNGKYHLIDVTFATASPWCFEYIFPKQGTIITDNGQIRLKIVHLILRHYHLFLWTISRFIILPMNLKKLDRPSFYLSKYQKGEHALILGSELFVFNVIYKKDD